MNFFDAALPLTDPGARIPPLPSGSGIRELRPGIARLLLVRLSAVGDVINTLPALSALRSGFPRARLGFLVEDRARDLIVGHPCVDRVHLYPRRRWARMARRPWEWPVLAAEVVAFVRDLRAQRYDLALDFQSNFKGAFHSILSGARRRVGFSRGYTKEANHLFSNLRVTPPGFHINRVQKFLSLAAGLGIRTDGAPYRLPESRAAAQRVDAFLGAQGLRPSGFAAIHPGTSDFGRLKRWRPERFAALAEELGRRHGLRSLVTWGPGERELAGDVAARSSGHALPALQTASLLDLAELLRRARLFVGCDSGPLHLASAVGAPSVALFGPKDPRIYGPWNPRSRVVRPPDGAMATIAVEDVLRAAEELLRAGPG